MKMKSFLVLSILITVLDAFSFCGSLGWFCGDRKTTSQEFIPTTFNETTIVNSNNESLWEIQLNNSLPIGKTIFVRGELIDGMSRLCLNFTAASTILSSICTSSQEIHYEAKFLDGTILTDTAPSPFKIGSIFDLRVRILDDVFQVFANKGEVAIFQQPDSMKYNRKVQLSGKLKRLDTFDLVGARYPNPLDMIMDLKIGQRFDLFAQPIPSVYDDVLMSDLLRINDDIGVITQNETEIANSTFTDQLIAELAAFSPTKAIEILLGNDTIPLTKAPELVEIPLNRVKRKNSNHGRGQTTRRPSPPTTKKPSRWSNPFKSKDNHPKTTKAPKPKTTSRTMMDRLFHRGKTTTTMASLNERGRSRAREEAIKRQKAQQTTTTRKPATTTKRPKTTTTMRPNYPTQPSNWNSKRGESQARKQAMEAQKQQLGTTAPAFGWNVMTTTTSRPFIPILTTQSTSGSKRAESEARKKAMEQQKQQFGTTTSRPFIPILTTQSASGSNRGESEARKKAMEQQRNQFQTTSPSYGWNVPTTRRSMQSLPYNPQSQNPQFPYPTQRPLYIHPTTYINLDNQNRQPNQWQPRNPTYDVYSNNYNTKKSSKMDTLKKLASAAKQWYSSQNRNKKASKPHKQNLQQLNSWQPTHRGTTYFASGYMANSFVPSYSYRYNGMTRYHSSCYDCRRYCTNCGPIPYYRQSRTREVSAKPTENFDTPLSERFDFFFTSTDESNQFTLSFRFSEGVVVRNTYREGKWETEERDGAMPIENWKIFDMTVLNTEDELVVYFGGKRFTAFQHREATKRLQKLKITGDIEVMRLALNNMELAN